jgi:uncharacterized SAM-binding protein YcdF (DUF218 family)
MFYVIKFIYSSLLLPPGIFLVGLLLLAYRSYRRNKAMAKTLVVIVLVIYISSTGLAADAVIHSLESKYAPPAEPRGDVVIVLGGGATLDTPNLGGAGHVSGNAANRLITAALLYHRLGVPVIVSGGKVFESTGVEADISKRILLGLGIPENKIIVENTSLNTTQNAMNSAALVKQYGFKQPILVTSAFHMQRAVLQFEKAGLKVMPFPTDYLTNAATKFHATDLLPSAWATCELALGAKEYLGIAAAKWY